MANLVPTPEVARPKLTMTVTMPKAEKGASSGGGSSPTTGQLWPRGK